MYEITADAIDFLLYHTKEARCNWIGIHVQNLTVTSSFQRLVKMNVLVAQQMHCRNGFEYGLANLFAENLPQQQCFDKPELAFCYMYPYLNKTTSEDFSKGDEYSPWTRGNNYC